MPSYKKRKLYDKKDMMAALSAIREKKMGYLLASKSFNVPKSTLFRFSNEKNLSVDALISKKIGRKPIFDLQFENELVEYVLKMESSLYILTKNDKRRLAFQLAKKKCKANNFKNEMVGRKWLTGFLNRNKDRLSIRKSPGTSFKRARAYGFTKKHMDEFYDILEKIYDEKKITADRIFNVDVTGLSIVQSKNQNIIGHRDKTQISAMSSVERSSLITIVTCMSPAGIFVPPMVIFPRKNMTESLMRGAPNESIGRAHPTGWIQTYLFTEWFEHFVKFVRPTEAFPVLLLLDGHFSHTKNIEVFDIAERNNVIIISLPPYCTNKVQPIDRTFMSALKDYYSTEIRIWLQANNRSLTQYDIMDLFGKAYKKCLQEKIAANGFSIVGIYPLNRQTFSDADYVAAANGACDLNEQGKDRENGVLFQNVRSYDASAISPLAHIEYDEAGPYNPSGRMSYATQTSPCDVISVPKSKQRTSNLSRKSTRSTIITGSTYKGELVEAEDNKKSKPNLRKFYDEKTLKKNTKTSEQLKKAKSKENKGKGKGKKTKKLLDEISYEDTESDTYKSDTSGELELPINITKTSKTDAYCFFCNGNHSEDKRGEKWVQCLMCNIWAHVECAGYEVGMYICDYCK